MRSNESNNLNDPLLEEEIKPSSGGGEWLITFSDLSMLLLVFFILLFSMSHVDKQRFENTVKSVRGALASKFSDTGASIKAAKEEGVLLDTVRLQRQIIQKQEQTFTDVRTFLTENGKEGEISAILDKGTITLRVPSDVLFESGSVELSPAAETALAPIVDILLKHKEEDINIKGYTDNVEPTTGRFKDLWEISSLRAVNVLRYLIKSGISSSSLTATGFADVPLFPNDTDANRAKNRRVEFVLERKIGE